MMNGQLDIEPLLDKMEAGLRQLLQQRGVSSPALVGIRTGGVWLAAELAQRLQLQEPFGELDISFYRDDFSRIGLNPKVKPSSLPFDTADRDVVLIDDVIMSGRTIRAAMNEIFDYGRPASIILATLIDLGARELPVQPDVRGLTLTLANHQRIKLRGPDPLRIELEQA
jgi:pyrimidine operon attenuation protein/uracil phosphoribosyltransferase